MRGRGEDEVVGGEEGFGGVDSREIRVKGREEGGKKVVGGMGWGSDNEDAVKGTENGEVNVGG